MSTNLKDLQRKELGILKEFIRLCEKHDLTYYLSWGSCLGAIRHQGFIPWDDDIDIVMPIKDYKQFKEVCKQELNDQYFYQDHETDKNYFFCFAKLREHNTTFMLDIMSKIDIHWGVNIDIFPMYDVDKPILTNAQKKEFVFYKKLYYKFAYTKRKFYKTKGMIAYLKVLARCLWYMMYPESRRMKLIERTEDKLNKGQGDYYMDLEALNIVEPLPKAVYGDGVNMPFEDIMVKVPADYDTYLKFTFGDDYMDIPVTGSDKIYYHEDVIIDLQKSYKYYQEKI